MVKKNTVYYIKDIIHDVAYIRIVNKESIKFNCREKGFSRF